MTAGFFRPEDERFRTKVRRFIETELRPRAEAWERLGTLPRRALVACARRGYLSIDPLRNAVLAEEMPGCECPGLALTVFVQATLVAPMLDRLADAEQRRRFLAPLLRARQLGAVAVTEPDAGSDVGAIRCRAEDDKGSFVLTGTKTYITNAAAADFFIVAAVTADGPRPEMSLLLVPSSLRGVRVTPLRSLGLRTSGMAKITFSRVRVPAANLLGDRGAGLEYVQDALNRERLYGGLASVAWAERVLTRTAAFARARRVFGKPLTKFQAIRHQFAELSTSLEAARQLNYATFARWLSGADVRKEICMIKLFSYEAVQRTIDRCLQVHGGAGYIDDHWIARAYRDARALTIAAGTPEVMKDLIAAHLHL